MYPSILNRDGRAPAIVATDFLAVVVSFVSSSAGVLIVSVFVFRFLRSLFVCLFVCSFLRIQIGLIFSALTV